MKADELIKKLERVYKAIDKELTEYSRLANEDKSAEAQKHMAEAEKLTAEAHEITHQLATGKIADKGIAERVAARFSEDHKWKVLPTEANLAIAASSFADKAFAKGERHGGHGNKTTYPKKWYPALERLMGGALDAEKLSFFDTMYDHAMRNRTFEKDFPLPTGRSLRHTL